MFEDGTTNNANESIVERGLRVGEKLRQARERRGETLKEVSDALGLKVEYLGALETMYAGGIPRGYINMYLRGYAGHLGLSAEGLITQFAEECGVVSQAEKTETRIVAAERGRSALRAAVGGFVVALALVGLGAGAVTLAGQNSEEIIESTTTPENRARESLFASAEINELKPQLPLSLTALKPAWLEVRGEDGTVYRERVMAPGETYHPRIGAGWTVSARNGRSFEWRVGDLVIGPLGEEAGAVYAVSVDMVARDAQDIASPAIAGRPDVKSTR